MQETGLAVYVHFANLGATLTVLGVVLREYKVYGRIKERMNELWFNYCGERQKLYSPVENGATPMIPPRPSQQ